MVTFDTVATIDGLFDSLDLYDTVSTDSDAFLEP